MPTLTLSRASATKTRVQVAADDGTIQELYDVSLTSPRAQKRLCEATCLPPQRVAQLAAQAAALPKGDVVEESFQLGGSVAVGPFAVTLRGLQQPLDTGATVEASTPADALLQAFDVTDFASPEPVLQWDGLDRLCCLDVDYHALPLASRPSEHWLHCKAAGISPRPFAFHASHGRGCKLFYSDTPGYTARELAAVAAVAWAAADRRASCDLVHITRHPKYPRPGYPNCGTVHTQTADADTTPIALWLQRSVDPAAVDDWLDSRGWQRGQHLPHTDCVIDPNDTAAGVPVFVGEDGVFCHRCAAKSLSLGKAPGFTPYAALVGGAPPRAAVMIRNAVHWTHARLILKHETGLPDALLRPAYTAAVKLQHGADSDAARAVGVAGSDMIRMQGRWVSPDGVTTYQQHLHGLLNALPAVWCPGTREVMPDRRDLFLQAGDLSHYGYFPLSPVHGATIYGRHLEYPDDRVAFATPAHWCREPGVAPRYRKAADRLPVEEAWQRVETVFPGINRRYVRLLVALKGLAEGAAVQCPFCFVTGPSGSAKSTTVHVAASICGDTATEPLYSADSVRLMQAVAGGLDSGSFVVLNEVFKEAAKQRLKPRAAVDPILTMTPSASAHRLYIGPRPLGRLPALVLTDVDIPPAVASDLQLARRLIWVPLTDRMQWDDTIAKAGFGEPGRYRASSPEAAAACDSILSDVTDQFFREPMTVAEIAKELGFGTLEEQGGVKDARSLIRSFFKAVCEAPDLQGSDAARFPAAGWKRISRGDSSDLRELWDALADGMQGDEWYGSRTVKAEDLKQVLGAPAVVAFDAGSYRNALFVRFRVGSTAAPTWTSAHGQPLTCVA